MNVTGFLADQAFFPGWKTLGEICIRTIAVYIVLLAGLRITGRRQIGQLTPFDLVVLLLLSNAVQNAMTGPDTSILGGIMAAITLLVVNVIVAQFRMRSRFFRKMVEGSAVTLVRQGKILGPILRHQGITEEELLANLRQHEVSELEQCELAMLEIDGTISVIRRDPQRPEHVIKTRKKLTQHHKHQ
ncbi:MAG: DUF421 domain-containing protein [Fimbriimonadaceae bacterium]|nr:DUF421 domain-containing protein [Fimbriimonadaceae bacterium]